MSLNEGKEIPKTFTFLGYELNIEKIPAGIAIPFAIEVDKVRVMSMKAAEAIAQDADTADQMEALTAQYFADPAHLMEAHELSLQSIKAVSVFTEYVTDGKLTEDFIQHHADMDEVNEFLIQIQEAINTPLKKHLARESLKT